MSKFRVSERRSCRATGFPLATIRYRSRSNDNGELLKRMRDLGEKYPRYGHRRLHSLLIKEGLKANHKKTARLYYSVLGLQLRRKKNRKKIRLSEKPSPSHPSVLNEVWAMDFVSDQLLNSRRIRGLTIIDVFSRYCHGVELDTSITGGAVVRILDMICAFYGYPRAITVDNGPELTSRVVRSWAGKHRVELSYSRPGKPTDNPFIESFNGKFRDEFLNANCFTSLSLARKLADAWREEYNCKRPHSALGMVSPSEFLRNQHGVNTLDLIA